MSSRIPSPARSQGAKPTPRKYKPGPRSVGSPARSNTSVKLSAVLQDSFALSPLPRRSVLTDTTDIDVPGRRSWWKKLDENSREVMEVFSTNEPAENSNAIEEYIDVDILSQEKEKKNYPLDLPDSSDGESISSIVIPQRKLFTQKDNHTQNKFGQIIDNRETLAKLHKTQAVDERALNVAPKNLFNQGTKTRSKPIFPAALLNISANKTLANKTKELAANEAKGQVKNLFGNRAGTKRKNMFADFIVSDSEDDISEIQPKVFGFGKKPDQKRISKSRGQRESSPTSSVNESEIDDWRHLPSSTMVEHQLEDALITTPVKRARLNKLTEVGESINTESTVNKTKQSNKSINSKNKLKNRSQKYTEVLGNEILDDNEELQTSKQNNSHKVINDEKTSHGIDSDQREEVENKMQVDENLGEGIENDKQKESEVNQKQKSMNESKLNLKNKSINKKHNNIDKIDEMVFETQNNEQDKDVHKDNHEIRNNCHEAIFDQSKIRDAETHEDLENGDVDMHTDQNVSEEIQDDEDQDEENDQDESEKLEDQEETQESNKSESEVIEDDYDKINNEEDEAEQNKSLQNRCKNRSQENADSNEEESDVQNENQDKSEDNEEQMSVQNVSQDVEDEVEEMQANNTSGGENNDDEDERNIENEEINTQEEREPSQDNMTEEEIHNVDDEEHVNEDIELKYEEDQGDSNDGVDNDSRNVDENIEEDNIQNQSLDNQLEKHEQSEANVSHDTTGRYRKKNETQIKSPEAILHDKTNQMESFTAQGRNTSVRKTKSIIKNLNIRPSLAPVRESTGMDGTRDSSMDASGWDSHRVTRKTLRQTLGKDFTPRKSLRALVMEKSAKRHTNFTDINAEISRLPQANSTELPEPFDMDEEDDVRNVQGSDQEVSEKVEQTSEVDAVEEMQEPETELSNRARQSSEVDSQDAQESGHELSNSQRQSIEVENENETEESNNALLDRTHQSTEVEDGNETEESDHEESNRTHHSTEVEDANEAEESDHEVSNRTHQSSEDEDYNEMDESEHEVSNKMHQSTEVADDNEMEESDHDELNKTQESTDVEEGNETEESDHELPNRTRHSSEVDDENDMPEIDQEWSKRTNRTSEIEVEDMEEPAHELSNTTRHSTEVEDANEMEVSEHEVSNRTRNSTGVDDAQDKQESDHELSKRTRQTTLEMYLQKIKKQNIEKKRQMEERVRNSLKAGADHRDIFNPFKIPAKPVRRMKVPQTKPKTKPLKSSVIPLDMLPEEVLQDFKYKPPKRYQPASWTTKKLYKFLETKLEAKYDYKARVRAEKLVEMIYNFTKDIRRHDVAPASAVDVLKHEMARLEIVNTHFEFYEFFNDYMPREVKIKVVPDIVNKISMPKHGVFSNILIT